MNVSIIPTKVMRTKRKHIQRRLSILCDIIQSGDKVLDIGCGVGSYVTDALGYLPIKVTGIDYDEKSIQYARQNNYHNNVDYLVASGESYQSKEKYDVVVCSHVLEHNVTPKVLLGNIGNLLKDGGKLYLAIPNGYGCFECENWIPKILGLTRFGQMIIKRYMNGKVKDSLNHDSPHIQYFNMKAVNNLLNDTGYKVVCVFNEQVLGGVVSDRTILKLPLMERLNLAIATMLPNWVANGWIIICQK